MDPSLSYPVYRQFREDGLMDWMHMLHGRYRMLYEDSVVPPRLIGVENEVGQPILWFNYDGAGELITSVSNAHGGRVDYVYDSQKRLMEVYDSTQQWVTRYGYHAGNELAWVSYPDGFTEWIHYTQDGGVASVSNSFGGAVVFTYDVDNARNLIYVQMETQDGLVEETWFDKEWRLVRLDINGQTVREVSYSPNNRVHTYTDADGTVTIARYDELGNPLSIARNNGETHTWTYRYVTWHGQVVAVLESYTDPYGVRTLYDFNDAGVVERMVEAAGTPQESELRFHYGEAPVYPERMSQATAPPPLTAVEMRPAGYSQPLWWRAQWSSTPGGRRQITAITDPASNVWNYADYSPVNGLSPELVTGPYGEEIRRQFDGQNRLVSLTDVLNRTFLFSYNTLGKVTGISDEEGLLIGFGWQGDRLTSISNRDGEILRGEYDLEGRLTRVQTEGVTAWENAYDNQGRLTRTVFPDGKEIQYRYARPHDQLVERVIYPHFTRRFERTALHAEAPVLVSGDWVVTNTVAGNIVHQQVERINEWNGKTSRDRLVFDYTGRLVERTTVSGVPFAYLYDVFGFIQRITFGDGYEVQYELDALHRLVAEVSPGGHRTSFQHNEIGQVTNRISPDGRTHAFTYNANHELIEAVFPDGSRRRLDVDAAQNITQLVAFASGSAVASQSIQFTYERDLCVEMRNADVTYRREFDHSGRLIADVADYGSFALTNRYQYGRLNLVTNYAAPYGVDYAYSFDASGNLMALSIPGQGSVTWSGHGFMGPASARYPGGMSVAYGYDGPLGLDSIQAVDAAQQLIYALQSDLCAILSIPLREERNGRVWHYATDELDRLSMASNEYGVVHSWGYDAEDNRIRHGDEEWEYNDVNQLLAAGDVTYTYDANGRRVERHGPQGTFRYVYDDLDQLIRVETGAGAVVAEYGYDAIARRVWKDVQGVRTFYHYSLYGLSGEYDASGNLLRSYGYAPGGIVSTAPVFQRMGNVYYWSLVDRLGNVLALVDSAGAMVWEAEHHPYGAVNVLLETVSQPFRLPGQYYDAETGLHYNWFRYYDPHTGGYLTPDPLASTWNLYAYAYANPHRYIDPLGLRNTSLSAGLFLGVAKFSGEYGPASIKAGVGADINVSNLGTSDWDISAELFAGGDVTIGDWTAIRAGGYAKTSRNNYRKKKELWTANVGAGYMGFGLQATSVAVLHNGRPYDGSDPKLTGPFRPGDPKQRQQFGGPRSDPKTSSPDSVKDSLRKNSKNALWNALWQMLWDAQNSEFKPSEIAEMIASDVPLSAQLGIGFFRAGIKTNPGLIARDIIQCK